MKHAQRGAEAGGAVLVGGRIFQRQAQETSSKRTTTTPRALSPGTDAATQRVKTKFSLDLRSMCDVLVRAGDTF